jgi:hypothetical protein
MCDYSLYTIPNRLAQEGEELVLHRFQSGTLGFASCADLACAQQAQQAKPRTFWSRAREFFRTGSAPAIPAVCVAPGARLLLQNLPQHVQTSWQIGPSEVAVLTEMSERTYTFRDALLFSNGQRVLLQELPEGIRALVLTLTPVEEEFRRPVRREVRVA